MVTMVQTDARGHFETRVAPGRNYVYIARSSSFAAKDVRVRVAGEGKPDNSTVQTGATITVGAGQTRRVDFVRMH